MDGLTDGGADDQTTVDGTSEPAPADDPNSEGPTPDDTGVTPDGSVDDAAAADDGTGVVEAQVTTGGPAVIPAAFADVGELTGSASGYPLPAPTVIGQIDSRDSASTPWLLLIGANFVVAGGALVALRLRR